MIAAPLALGAQVGRSSGTIAIRNATVVPVVGARIPNGTVLIRDGRIAAVGASVAVPADARVIDAAGLFVYPGMIDSGTELGLVEISSVPGSTDTQEIGDFNPHNVALNAVNPHSELIPVTRTNGVTTAITSASGGSISGFAALMDLSGWTTAEMGVKRQAALQVTFPSIRRGRFGGGAATGNPNEELARRTQALRAFFADAKAYAETRARAGAQWSGRSNAPMDAMIPVLRGEVPVLFDLQSAEQIRGALALADTFGLKIILRGAKDAWQLADTLAARRIPVIVGPVTQSPEGDEPYDMIFANPGVLQRAGVLIAFQTSSASDARNLPYQAALASAYGLDPEAALKAVTINPATIWGVADRYGSIEAGKIANLMVTTGDPLDVRSTVRHLFIRGDEVPVVDRHTRLYEQFKARPRPR
jgi:imidazolonepropionase-like amidohydrolase